MRRLAFTPLLACAVLALPTAVLQALNAGATTPADDFVLGGIGGRCS